MPKNVKKKMIVGIALAIGITAFLAFALQKEPVPNAGVQLSRIDFEAPLEKEEANAVQRAVMSTAGVRHCYINASNGIVAFSYDLSEQDKEAILAAVQQVASQNARLYEVTDSTSTSGCPVTGTGSPIRKVIAYAGQVWPF